MKQEYRDLLKFMFRSIGRFLIPTGPDPDSGPSRPDSTVRELDQEGGRILSPVWEREMPLGLPSAPATSPLTPLLQLTPSNFGFG